MAGDSIKPLTNFIFELGVLKKFRHCGVKFAGVNNPDSIAEHAFRTAQIGYLLAIKEKNKHPEKVAMMCLVHDNGEARIGDHHKIAQRYLETDDAEEKAYYEQVKTIAKSGGTVFWDLFEEFIQNKTEESMIAHDADYLETAFQAKEYKDIGFQACQSWLDNVEKALHTNSAKKVFRSLVQTQFTEWWKGLK